MKTLNILVLADEESASLWDFFEPSKLEGIDLIISCGDLNPQYLSFLAIFFTVQSSMFMETMMNVTKILLLKDVSVLKIRFMNTKVFVFLVLEDL